MLNDTLSSYALEARITMYLNSINAFLENPLFGTIWYHNDTTPILEIIGYHSYMLDIIALFGIMLGVLAYWLVFYPLIKRFIETKRYNHVIISIIAALFIILFFNNQVPALGIVIFYTMNSYYLDSKGRST
ncbi:MAG: hypothetical protein K9K32_07830 [Halanaerobiales bacterium]|nr:hypothetical protein [Halanaerobiales bacterium]